MIAHTWTYEYVGYVNTGNRGNGGSAGFANLSLWRLKSAQPSFWCKNKRTGYSYARPCFCKVWDAALKFTSWWNNSPKTTSVLVWPVYVQSAMAEDSLHQQSFSESQKASSLGALCFWIRFTQICAPIQCETEQWHNVMTTSLRGETEIMRGTGNSLALYRSGYCLISNLFGLSPLVL